MQQNDYKTTKRNKRKARKNREKNREKNQEKEMSAARPKPTPTPLKVMREWFSFAVALITIVAGIIFWVQHAGDNKYKVLEQDIVELKQDLKEITKQNSEILRLIGQLEGKISRGD